MNAFVISSPASPDRQQGGSAAWDAALAGPWQGVPCENWIGSLDCVCGDAGESSDWQQPSQSCCPEPSSLLTQNTLIKHPVFQVQSARQASSGGVLPMVCCCPSDPAGDGKRSEVELLSILYSLHWATAYPLSTGRSLATSGTQKDLKLGREAFFLGICLASEKWNQAPRSFPSLNSG